MLSIKDLSYSYDQKEFISFPDFSIEKGDTLLVLGESGKGKTTLLHLLGGIISPQQGYIRINNEEIKKLRGKELDKFRAQNIVIIFQEAHFVRSLTVIENLIFVQKLSGESANYEFVNQLLEKVNLSERAGHMTSKLSQGEKQRLNILRAVISKPNLILADEPTSALDDTNCDKVMDLLLSLVDEVNASLIIVTHDNRLKDRFANKIELQ